MTPHPCHSDARAKRDRRNLLLILISQGARTEPLQVRERAALQRRVKCLFQRWTLATQIPQFGKLGKGTSSTRAVSYPSKDHGFSR
jgi:hypothetical protein